MDFIGHDAVQGAVAPSRFGKYPWRDGLDDACSRLVSAGTVWPDVLHHGLTWIPLPLILQGLIVGLQDPDKISHAGSIPVFSHIRNLSIGRGLASLPEPHQEICDVSHGVLSINHHVKHQLSGEAPQDWRKPAGTTPPALSRNCRLAGPVPLLSLWDVSLTLSTWPAPSRAGMKWLYLGWLGPVHRDQPTKPVGSWLTSPLSSNCPPRDIKDLH